MNFKQTAIAMILFSFSVFADERVPLENEPVREVENVREAEDFIERRLRILEAAHPGKEISYEVWEAGGGSSQKLNVQFLRLKE